MEIAYFISVCKKTIQLTLLGSLLISMSCKDDIICSIPIKVDERTQWILVPVTFNGETSDFLFDTGCSITTLKNYRVEDTIGKMNFKYFTFFSDMIVDRYPKGKFELGAFKMDIPFIAPCKEGNHVIGMDIISRYYWYFDLEKKIVKVSESPIPDLEKEIFGFDFYQHTTDKTVVVKLLTNPDNEFEMLFDTGAGMKVDFYLFQHRDSIPFKQWQISESDLFYQRNSDNWVWVSDSLQLGKYPLTHLLFMFDPDIQRIRRFNKKGYDGLITVNFIHRYKRFYIDPKAKKILFYGEKAERKEELKRFFDHIREVIRENMP